MDKDFNVGVITVVFAIFFHIIAGILIIMGINK